MKALDNHDKDKATRQKFLKIFQDKFDESFEAYRDDIISYLVAIGPLKEHEARETIRLQELKFYGVAGSGLLIVCASMSRSEGNAWHVIACMFSTITIISSIYFSIRLERLRTSPNLSSDLELFIHSKEIFIPPLFSILGIYLSFLSALAAIHIGISAFCIVITGYAFKYYQSSSPPRVGSDTSTLSTAERLENFKKEHPEMEAGYQLKELYSVLRSKVNNWWMKRR